MADPEKSQELNIPLPRKAIDSIKAYQQGKSEISDCAEPIKLSSNESAYGPSPEAVAAYNNVAKDLHRYPDGSQYHLKQAIAETLHLDQNRIVCGNGSEELIGLVIRAWLDPGDELLLTENNFVMCPIYGKIQGANIVLAREQNYRIDVDVLVNEITDDTRLIIVANPNNPTGTYISRQELEHLHANIPQDVLLLIDDAYAEYVTADDYSTCMDLVENFENVIVTRTFSKIYALPALRIGWAYCPQHVADVLNKVRTPFNTNSAALAAAAAAIRDTEWTQQVKNKNDIERTKTISALEETGIEVVPSMANFYLLNFNNLANKSAKDAASWLERDGIIPRPVGGGSDDILRITIGLEAENLAVVDSLRAYMTD